MGETPLSQGGQESEPDGEQHERRRLGNLRNPNLPRPNRNRSVESQDGARNVDRRKAWEQVEPYVGHRTGVWRKGSGGTSRSRKARAGRCHRSRELPKDRVPPVDLHGGRENRDGTRRESRARWEKNGVALRPEGAGLLELVVGERPGFEQRISGQVAPGNGDGVAQTIVSSTLISSAATVAQAGEEKEAATSSIPPPRAARANDLRSVTSGRIVPPIRVDRRRTQRPLSTRLVKHNSCQPPR